MTGSNKSDHRLKDARLLIEKTLREGYFVVCVFSAIRGITDELLSYRSTIAAKESKENAPKEPKEEGGGLEGFIHKIQKPHLALARDLGLISLTTYAALAELGSKNFASIDDKDKAFVQRLRTQVNQLARRASTYYDEVPSAASLDVLAVAGERLVVPIVAEYFNSKWKRDNFPYQAATRNATDVGILTDGRFGDAEILPGTRYELIVVKQLTQDFKRGIVPIVTGFDGVYKAAEDDVEFVIDGKQSGLSLEGTLDGVHTELDRQLRQNWWQERVAGEVGIAVSFRPSGRTPRGAREWEDGAWSSSVAVQPATNSPELISQAIQEKLRALWEQKEGLRVERLTVRLSRIEHKRGLITTLGRGGSDLTATYIAKALRAEGVYLVKDSKGVQTANPKVVPNAQTIGQVPYEFAIEAGNIQHKALRPAMEASLRVEVFDPKFPDTRSVIGPFDPPIETFLFTNPTPARLLSIRVPTNRNGRDLFQAILDRILASDQMELLEMHYEPRGIKLLLAEKGDVTRLEHNLKERLDLSLISEECQYFRIVGAFDQETLQQLTAALSTYRPLLFPSGRTSQYTFAVAIPAAIDANDMIRALHEYLMPPSRPGAGAPQGI